MGIIDVPRDKIVEWYNRLAEADHVDWWLCLVGSRHKVTK